MSHELQHDQNIPLFAGFIGGAVSPWILVPMPALALASRQMAA